VVLLCVLLCVCVYVCVQSHPDVLTNQMIAHFQELFGVKRTEGVFPKMSELFLFTNEMRNFLTALRSLLGLGMCVCVCVCVYVPQNY